MSAIIGLTRAELYDMEVALLGTPFPRNAYNLHVIFFALTEDDSGVIRTLNGSDLNDYITITNDIFAFSTANG